MLQTQRSLKCRLGWHFLIVQPLGDFLACVHVPYTSYCELGFTERAGTGAHVWKLACSLIISASLNSI